MLKILILTYNLGGSASGIITHRIAEELGRQGCDIRIISESNSINNIDSAYNCYVAPHVFDADSLLFRALKKVGRKLGLSCFEFDWIWINKAKTMSESVLKEWKPDFIYCRTTPLDPLYVAKYLKKKYSIKCLLHFTDPVPAPSEYINDKRFIQSLRNRVKKETRFVDLFSFGTDKMRTFEEKQLDLKLDPSFISPDAASSSKMIETKPANRKYVIVYLGGFNISRNPHNIFRAIKRLNSEGANIELRIYSKSVPIYNNEDFDFIRCMGRVADTSIALRDADAFLDLDIEGTPEAPSVFISSKLKDYLLVNKPIISVTPEDSPCASLLNGFNTIFCVRNRPECIYNGIKRMTQAKCNIDDFKERKDLIDLFSPERIATEIISQINSCL